MSIELTDDQYLDLLLRGRGQKGAQSNAGGCFWTLFAIGLFVLMAILTADHFGLIPPTLVDRVVGAPQTTFSTPLPTARPQPVQPIGGAAPWPTLTPEPAEPPAPTLTIPPAPTVAPSFWTQEERAAFTATAEAWYDPATLPTAPPAFAEYAANACSDPEQVAESLTLQLFCKK